MRSATIALSLSLAACASASSSASTLEESAAIDEAVSLNREVRAQTNGVNVWLRQVGKATNEAGRLQLVWQGRTSEPLAEAFSFVPDDAFGTTTVTGDKTFQVALDGGSELNSILSGLPLLVRVTTKDGRTVFLSVTLGAQFASFSGDRELWVNSTLDPVYLRDDITNLRYRAKVALPTRGSLSVQADALPDPLPSGETQYRVDWDYARFQSLFDNAQDRVGFSAKTSRHTLQKRASVQLVAAKLDITTEDPYDHWPTASCDAKVLACVRAKPKAHKDYGDCGSYRQVTRCMAPDVP